MYYQEHGSLARDTNGQVGPHRLAHQRKHGDAMPCCSGAASIGSRRNFPDGCATVAVHRATVLVVVVGAEAIGPALWAGGWGREQSVLFQPMASEK